MENKMINQEIKPFIIVGINNREPQAIDTIFGSSKIDFRTTAMMGYMFLSSDDVDFSIPHIVMNLSNRKISFRKFIVDEVSRYLIDYYNIKERNRCTLEGFSNGGAIV